MTIPGPIPGSTVQILLDNFLGAFPYDISAYAEDPGEELTWIRGVPDEWSTPQPGSMTLCLDNRDGRFTFGSGTYALGTDQQIKLIVNGVTRWQGKVQAWPVSWPGGSESMAYVEVTAIDDLAQAARRPLQSALVEDILGDSPSALYQLSELTGATQAADSSGNGMPSLAVTGSGTPLTFGTGIGPVDGLSATQFLGGTFLRGSGGVWLSAGGAITLEAWIVTSQVPASNALILQADTGLDINATASLALGLAGGLVGKVGSTILTSAGSINDGLLHHIALTMTGAGVMNIYIDGTGVGVTGAGSPLLTYDTNRLSIAPSDIGLTTPFVGTVAHAATLKTALPGVDITARSATRLDYAAETAAARLARVAGYAGLTTGTLDAAGGTTMGPASQAGKNALDVFIEVAEATQGVVYLNGSNQLTSRNGYTLTGDLTPTLSLDSQYVVQDVAVEADMSQVVNYATGKATGSENVFVASNALSRGVHGMYAADYEWNVGTDAQALDRTNWRINTYAGSQSRIPTLTIDLMGLSGATLTSALALDVGTFLRVTNLPTQTPAGATADLLVLGISETIGVATWSLTLNCVRHNLYAAWILEDSLWGQLDGTTKLYF